MKIIAIIDSLERQPRPLTEEENLRINEVADELRRAENQAARWAILEREGLGNLDGYDLEWDVIAKLADIRRGAMN